MTFKNIKGIDTLGKLFRTGWLFLESNKPAVMTGAAMGGAILLTGSSAKAAVNIYKIKDDIADLPTMEKAKAVIPLCVETAIILLFVEIMIFGANHENAKRIASLAGAWSISESQLKEYREKAEEVVGTKKANQIEEAIFKDYAAKENITNARIYDTGYGTTLYKDLSTGRLFYSDRGFLDAVVNDLNNELNSNGPASANPYLYFVTKNDLYRRWGLEEVDGGNDMGWNSFSGNLIEVDIKPVYLPDKTNVIHYIRFENLAPTFDDGYSNN